jgi:molybdopterin-guanine dinucleotide biosynthesis protein A
LLRRLLELGSGADACVPLVNGLPMTTCAVYATRVAATARELVAGGRLSLRGLLDVVAVQWVEGDTLRELDPDLRSFHDCDTPERYREALRLAGLGR